MTDFDISRMNVLIVEDNLHFRTLIRTILQTLGVESVEEARDGSEAFEVLSSFDADLAIIDWKMDGLNGLECVRRIRNDEDSPNRFLPIIMVTGYTEESLARDARDIGVNDFLGKPISAKSLMSRIIAVLEDKRDFIDAPNYFGPDRRRSQQEYMGEERRKK
ncbi:MAG: response regulator [Rhodospirillales bacterium]|nr:response regulator [Rhodospirillales bacterium]